MTVNEFRAWLEGFEENLQGKAPNKAQWKRIKERLSEVMPNHRFAPDWYWWTYTSYPVTVPVIGVVASTDDTITTSVTASHNIGLLEAEVLS